MKNRMSACDRGAGGRPRPPGLFSRWRASTSGAAAIEFAIILPVFILFLMGLMEFGRLFWVQVSLRQAVEQTARYAMAEYTRESFYSANFATWFNAWTPSLEGRAPDQIFGWDPSNISFVATTTAATSSAGIDYVTIDASYTFEFIFDVIPGMSTKTLTATSTTPLVGQGNSFAG
jgi:Flp pilus assembly protein TadG